VSHDYLLETSSRSGGGGGGCGSSSIGSSRVNVRAGTERESLFLFYGFSIYDW